MYILYRDRKDYDEAYQWLLKCKDIREQVSSHTLWMEEKLFLVRCKIMLPLYFNFNMYTRKSLDKIFNENGMLNFILKTDEMKMKCSNN